MNAQQIIDLIRNAGAEDNQSILYTLEDGAALLALGITDADQEAVEEAHEISNNARIYSEAARQYGEVTHEGRSYALLGQADLTNRVFYGWEGDAADGDEYISEWSAPAIDQDGEEYVVRWRFDAIKGQEPEDGSSWPWHMGYEVIAA